MGRSKKQTERPSKGAKRHSSGSAKGKQQANKSSQKERAVGEENEYTIGRTVVSKWKPLGKSTLQYTHQLIKSSASSTLSKVHYDDYEDAEEVLEELKNRMTASLASLKAPTPICADYVNLKRQTDLLQEELDANSAQAERMEEEIQLLEKKSEKVEWELAKKKKEAQDTSRD